jgi:hypothetical protein
MTLEMSGPSADIVQWIVFYNRIGIAFVYCDEGILENDSQKWYHFNVFIDDSAPAPPKEELYEFIKNNIFVGYWPRYSFSMLYVETFGNHNIAGKDEMLSLRSTPPKSFRNAKS